ncbi:aldo/keto reductase [Stachybotrys elegans]|uniref:Aldo/keto reductase n=1 Tax=Stachybotrys elegans TaxID=80388 RepID=A0A8K0SGV6_9HYPO|nr:aldo/keto reductase [Stachybotrys elegans]
MLTALLITAIFGTAIYLFQLSLPAEPHHSRHGGFLTSINDIPPLGLGTWLSDRDKVAHAVEYAVGDKRGYRHIDAAAAYKNEDKVGKGIKASGINRKDIWVTSKLWNSDHQRDAAHRAIKKTIDDLSVEYLDLYLMHWPVAFLPDSKDNELDTETTIIDTWRTMEELVRANYTRYIGISNFSPADVETILAACEICPYAHELELHPYLQQQEFVDWHLEHGIKVIAYSPLGNTNPTYDSKLPPLLDDPFWNAMAAIKQATVAQIVLAWGLQRGTVVIPKSVHEKHIEDNLRALEITFSEEEMRRIGDQDRRRRMNDPGRSWGVALFNGLDDPTDLGRGDEL